MGPLLYNIVQLKTVHIKTGDKLICLLANKEDGKISLLFGQQGKSLSFALEANTSHPSQ